MVNLGEISMIALSLVPTTFRLFCSSLRKPSHGGAMKPPWTHWLGISGCTQSTCGARVKPLVPQGATPSTRWATTSSKLYADTLRQWVNTLTTE